MQDLQTEVNKHKPWTVDWGRRVPSISKEEAGEVDEEYKRLYEDAIERGCDNFVAKTLAESRSGKRSHEFSLVENEMGIFQEEEKWRMPWSDLKDQERNAFFKLFLNQVSGIHFRGPCDAPMPDFRLILMNLLEDDLRFMQAIASGK